MSIHPRRYAGSDDFERMRMIVRRSERISFHIGDLNWWSYYIAPSRGLWLEDSITLWEDQAGLTLGWIFLFSDRRNYDLVILPEWRGSLYEAEMTLWAERQLTMYSTQGERIEAFASADDSWRCTFLEAQGYQRQDYLVCFTRTLDAPLPQPVLPPGFHFLERMSLEHIEARAEVHFDAFHPSRMSASAYADFMQAPDYDPELDIVVVAPDGRFAAFVMGWFDTATRSSVFEPVGTRHDMQRRGLGKAALLEGLRRLQARGAQLATVCTHASDAANIAFYRSGGFEIVNVIHSFTKPVESP
jgi:ribosomal protein S18 acetylase RimI-like enzyme